ncbi:MAG: sensor histidine kinase [Christensenellales bacterium]|jgi:signal transduction histidine kinase
MSTTKRMIFINAIMVLIGFICVIVFISYNSYNIKKLTETSINNPFITEIEEIKTQFEEEGGSYSEMYEALATKFIEYGYYTIVAEGDKEIYFNLDVSKRCKAFYKAFDRAVEKGSGIIIEDNVLMFAFQNPEDPKFTFHIIDLEYTTYNDYVRLQNKILMSMAALALILVVVTLLIEINEAAKPLRKLSKATHEIRSGNLDYELKTNYKDEIGIVYKDFDALRLTLKEAKSERERMARDREEYIAGITHDLKTPLTSIIGFSKGLLDGVANTKEKSDKYLNIIYNTAKHMNSLIEKLKDFSLIDSDKMEFNFEKVNVFKLINDFVAKNAASYLAKDVTITTRLGVPLVSQKSSGNDFVAMIDKDEFNRVLSNILNNTVKYKRPGMAYSEIVVSRGYGQILISISDDGPGVKENELDLIFNCFYRGDMSRTRPTEGSGLGLYLVSKIIAAHNGTVKAVNDKGLKIIITLPEVRNEKNINY